MGMHPGVPRRQRFLGVFLVAFGVLTTATSALIGGRNLGGLGLASFIIGLLLIYLQSPPSFSAELVEAFSLSSLANVERVLRELGPDTRSLYLKVHDRLDVPMVFLPMEENPASVSESSLIDEDRFLVIASGDPPKTGLLLEAPGASLLALMERESGVDFTDLGKENLLDSIRGSMVGSLELVDDIRGTVTKEGVYLEMRDGSLGSLSNSVATKAPNVASRLGCPICSAAICATIKATKCSMVLENAAHSRGRHSVTLRFVGGETSEAS